MRILLTIGGLLISYMGYSQKYIVINRDLYGLYGNVRSVKEVYFMVNETNGESQKATEGQLQSTLEFNTDGFMTHKSVYDGDGAFSESYDLTYNKHGVIKEINKNSSGLTIEKLRKFNRNSSLKEECGYRNTELDYKVIYKYDRKGNMIMKYCPSLEDGVFSEKTIRKYDKRDNLIEETFIEASGSIEMITKVFKRFDNKNKIIEYLTYSDDSSLFIRIEYKYDTVGNLLREEQFGPMGDSQIAFANQYNSQGQKTETIEYAEGKQIKLTRYDYDINGREVGSKEYNTDGVLVFEVDIKGGDKPETIGRDLNRNLQEKTTYDLDSQKNWIRKTIINNGKPSYVIEREIDYY